MAARTWGLTLSGSRARVVRDLEDRQEALGLPEELGLEIKPAHLRDLMADKPGRSMASAGYGRSAMEYASDPVIAQKEYFCDEVLDLLGQHLEAGDFDRLLVAAGPEMLGLLRTRRSTPVREATVHEVAKDLTGLAQRDLRHRFQDMAPSRLAG